MKWNPNRSALFDDDDVLNDREIDVLAEYEAAFLSCKPMPSQLDLATLFDTDAGMVHRVVRSLVRKDWLCPGGPGRGRKSGLSLKAVLHLRQHEQVIALATGVEVAS